mmetsp:Transcript_64165/g.107320  ORF Transcript_64165/g.107320 Transcript_64165/m.107320 type:complete len:130 (-) Transcript_64165:99-488(-)
MSLAAESLQQVTDDILDHLKQRAGKIVLSLQPESVQAIIAQCMTLFQGRASQKGLTQNHCSMISLFVFLPPTAVCRFGSGSTKQFYHWAVPICLITAWGWDTVQGANFFFKKSEILWVSKQLLFNSNCL